MADPTRSLTAIFKRIQDATKQAVAREQMRRLGQFTVDIVVKRTRLGYGVSAGFGEKSALKKLSEKYIQKRKRFKGLSNTTTPSRSNLTFTGQMLRSVQVIEAVDGRVRFGPTGNRDGGGPTNAEVASYQEAQGRPFNRVSELEYQQVLREFKREFGDLLNKKGLLK